MCVCVCSHYECVLCDVLGGVAWALTHHMMLYHVRRYVLRARETRQFAEGAVGGLGTIRAVVGVVYWRHWQGEVLVARLISPHSRNVMLHHVMLALLLT